jgi:hypothetical protein
MKTILLAVACALAVQAQVTYTTVTGTLYRADGSTVNGSAVISWQMFTDPSGNINPAGTINATILNGVVSVNGTPIQLVPTTEMNIPGCVSPACQPSYTVSYTIQNGAPYRRFWVVPQSVTPVLISAIESASGGAEGPNATVALTQLAQGGAGLNYCLAWNGHFWDPSNSCGGGGGHPAGTPGQIQFNDAGNFGGFTMAGDCTVAEPNITCTKTNGVAFAPSATTNALNASNISSGTLATARGGTGAGTFTQGSVVVVGASGVYGQDNSNLFWDAMNHRLGIGKTSPLFALDILSTGSSTVPLQIQSTAGLNTNLAMLDGNSTNTWLLTAATSGQFALYDATANVDSMIIDPGGVNALHLFATGDFVIGSNPGDNGYRLAVTKSGSSGTALFQDQTASTGVTTLVVYAGAGQGSTNLMQFFNSSGIQTTGVDAVGNFFVRNSGATKAGMTTGGAPSFGFAMSSDALISWKSVNDLNSVGVYDTCLARNTTGVMEIDSCTPGTYRDLILRNITINGACTGSGCGGGGGGAGAPAYTLCSSGCSSTIPSSGSTISAVTHGQGANAFGYALDSSGNEIFPPNFSLTNNGSGLLTVTYTTAPSKIAIFGATGGFANPMTTFGDLIVGSTLGAPTRLPIGTNGYVLTVSGGTATWAAPVTVPAYTLCASGCSQTIPSSPFTITASVHGLGANAIAACFDSASPHNMIFAPACGVTESTLNGDLTFTYVTAPSKITIR